MFLRFSTNPNQTLECKNKHQCASAHLQPGGMNLKVCERSDGFKLLLSKVHCKAAGSLIAIAPLNHKRKLNLLTISFYIRLKNVCFISFLYMYKIWLSNKNT